MEKALKLIMEKSPVALSLAIEVLKALQVKSPTLSKNYENVVKLAFNDKDANFSDEERALIISFLNVETSHSKSYMLRVRLSLEEQKELNTLAEKNKMTVSEFVRKKIFS